MRYNPPVGKWCTVTVADAGGRRHSLDVLADSSFDAAHLYLTAAKANRESCLPVPTNETVFEVVAEGKVHCVRGTKLRDWAVAQGLVTSLARPDGNLTGLTNYEFSFSGKWFEALKEISD